jgi:hypothetical protein
MDIIGVVTYVALHGKNIHEACYILFFVYIMYIAMSQTDLHKFSMYFHTTLRNIGLYTTLSYGSLAYSRVYRVNTPIYDTLLISVSIAFLLISFILNYFLYQDIVAFIKKQDLGDELNGNLRISQAIFGIHGILFMLGLFTLLRSLAVV